MFDFLTDALSGNGWAYAIVFGVVALDAVLPLMPGEAVTIAGGVLAANGELSVWLMIGASIVAVFVGDNASYGVGQALGRRAARRFLRSEDAVRRLDCARRQLRRHGPALIIGARPIPGARTAMTFAAGTLEMEWRRFAPCEVGAAVLWGTYSVMLGYLGGQAFGNAMWKPLLVGLGIAAVISGIGALTRRLWLPTREEAEARR